MVVFFCETTPLVLPFSEGKWVIFLSLIFSFPKRLRSRSRSLGFSEMIFFISSKILSRIISQACFSISANLATAPMLSLMVG